MMLIKKIFQIKILLTQFFLKPGCFFLIDCLLGFFNQGNDIAFTQDPGGDP